MNKVEIPVLPIEEGGVVIDVNLDGTETVLRKRETRPVCPSCYTAALFRNGRCITCVECGWSSCDL